MREQVVWIWHNLPISITIAIVIVGLVAGWFLYDLVEWIT